jgi:hypothetical protein
MSLVLAIVVVVTFATLLEWLRIPPRARQVIDVAEASLAALRDPDLDDASKEQALQRHALRLFRLFGVIAALSLLALLIPVGAIWLMDIAGLVSLANVMLVLERVDFLVAAALVGVAVVAMRRRVLNR